MAADFSDTDPQEHAIAPISKGGKRKSQIAKQRRESQEQATGNDLSTVLKAAGEDLQQSDREIVDGLNGIARRQGKELIAELQHSIPAAYYEGISEAVQEGTGEMSENFRQFRKGFSANLQQVFGLT